MVDWNLRFKQQANWTRSLREFLYPQIGVPTASRILEVGCGTGVICADLHTRTHAAVFGGDIDFQRLHQANQANHMDSFFAGDAHHLPFSDAIFDVTLCHYLLLWLKSPLQALQEMTRVTRRGGYVAALAEPDYGSRIDYPENISDLGKWQTESLLRQGANPLVGRTLPALFSALGLTNIQFGASGFQKMQGKIPDGWELEWQVMTHDLQDLMTDNEISTMKQKDKAAWQSGCRVLWIPTFYIFGMKV